MVTGGFVSTPGIGSGVAAGAAAPGVADCWGFSAEAGGCAVGAPAGGEAGEVCCAPARAGSSKTVARTPKAARARHMGPRRNLPTDKLIDECFAPTAPAAHSDGEDSRDCRPARLFSDKAPHGNAHCTIRFVSRRR